MNPLTIACVTSISVWFRSKERPRNDVERDDLWFWPHEKRREPKIEMGEGEGEGKETLTLTLSSLPSTPSSLPYSLHFIFSCGL